MMPESVIIILMRNNFDINIPSIPSKAIKFKIQDIKSTAFGSQKNRFHQNKSFLTKKFIESFGNFTQKHQQTEQETEAESRDGGSRRPTNTQYRVFIPEEKKYLFYHLDKYKNYKAPTQTENNKRNRGHSFYKTGCVLAQPPQPRDPSHSFSQKAVSENYFFPNSNNKQFQTNQEKPKQAVPSCVFKNQTRKRAYLKEQSHINTIGPGQYYNQKKMEEGPKREVGVRPKNKLDYKRLKNIITNIVVEQDEAQPPSEEQGKEKEAKPSYMFRTDDRDRFGDQKYPIASRSAIPGPGAYNSKLSIEDQSQKVMVVEQQRKLLKQWFNN